MDLLTRLKKYKRKTGKTDEQIARGLGVTHVTLNNWMNGKKMSALGKMALESFLNQQEAQKEKAGV